MPSTWPTPRVWTAGERVSASKMNEISTALSVLFPYTAGGDMSYRDPAGSYLTRLAKPSVDSVLKMGNDGVLNWLAKSSLSSIDAVAIMNSGAEFTTTSTEFVGIPEMELDISLSKTCSVLVFAAGNMAVSSTAIYPAYLRAILGNTQPDPGLPMTYAGQYTPVSLVWRDTNLSAGNHTVYLQMKIGNASRTAYWGGGYLMAVAFN
jgi:hypothetical protein